MSTRENIRLIARAPLLAKDFSLAQVRSFSLLCKSVERREINRQTRVTAEAPA